ncbi:hypothetical protein [Dolosicoccus paucivorans]|uniref:Uncharacterized protein n=1 Tax=Dolosicoccus paucivorans TaxID=84521 RepID=A0A1G8KW48_9LACT|nr:hypothetical protein [Dolosicoccus paucivorans]PMB84237.1 hypothetical protein CJ206_04850 [Dolosicoccus paucivorans]PMC58517.1 hypothetical protein CJ205_04040 [Dolosicoccus paucivorans]SDI47606.1 hypothetical protein SAMN04487994_101437 [Dolosicoccus paucivorans]
MNNIIKAEIYKYIKNRWVLGLLLMSLFPLLFAFILFLDLPSMKIHASFTPISFVDSMWSFMLTTTLPILFFSYVASQLGESIRSGKIIYELTRVADRKKLIKGKISALCLLTIGFFLSVVILSIISFYIFISSSRFGLKMELDSFFYQELIGMVLAVIYLIFYAALSAYNSFYVSSFSVMIGNFLLTIIMSFVANHEYISKYIPGSIVYGAIIPEDKFYYYTFYQSGLLLVLIILLSVLSINKFKKVDIG